MNKRIFKKLYKRAEQKLASSRNPNEARSSLEVETQERILSPLERVVFLKEQHRRLHIFSQIKEELISEGLW